LASLRDALPTESFTENATKLAGCFIGLQASYVTWGILQEFVMTRSYGTGMFPSAVFLVFGNRLTALLVAASIVAYKQRTNGLPHGAPFYMYAPPSLSNVLSSWAQYSALNYVDFPTQTLFKSSKIIPVMLMGKVLQGKAYKWIEYVEALCITAGIATFMLSEKSSKQDSTADGTQNTSTQMFGIAILCVYVLADSFTSQWQSRVFKEHKVDQFQMMFGVNAFSILFTTLSLMQSGDGTKSIAFILENPSAMMHVTVLSLTSATGQLFIFYTIKKFGPVVFVLIMTTRQMLSLVMSCLLYGHVLGMFSVFGALIVFSTLLHRSRRNYKNNKK